MALAKPRAADEAGGKAARTRVASPCRGRRIVPAPLVGDFFWRHPADVPSWWSSSCRRVAANTIRGVPVIPWSRVAMAAALPALLFPANIHAPARLHLATEHDVSRQRTLVLLLRIAKRLRRDIDADDVRWILYAGADWDGKPFELPEPELVEQRRKWWAYQVGDLGRAAYEALLKWLLDTLEARPSGVSPEELIADAVDRLEIDQAGWPATWEAFEANIKLAANPLSDEEATAEYKLLGEVLAAGTGAQTAPLRSAQAAVELLAVLSCKTALERKFLAAAHGGDHPDAAARSIANELAFLNHNAGGGLKASSCAHLPRADPEPAPLGRHA